MKRLLLLASALLFFVGCGDYPPTARCPDELLQPPPIDCDVAGAAYDDLLVEVRSCEKASDCAESVSIGGCGCQHSSPIGPASDELICEYELALAQLQTSCDLDATTCQCAPYLGVACIQGQCTYR